ncbi:MAG TPA: DUF2314 domain-containing protein [Bacteroidia bacterium]|jgi:hypothetical protein|nr:DUF2314 domain-containing protein [Bacteroidia bacterium]
MKKIAFLTALLISVNLFSQDESTPPEGTKDKPVSVSNTDELKKLDKLIESPRKKAMKTLSKTKERYLKGLPKGETLYLTVRIFDKDGKFEQIYARVKTWEGDKISARIGNALGVVKEYKQGQLIEFKESDVLDWTIVNAKGEEEGNYIGKYIDKHR